MLAWIELIQQSSSALDIQAQIVVEVPAQPQCEPWCGIQWPESVMFSNQASDIEHDWVREDLVIIRDASVLSLALLERFSRFRVRCHDTPRRLSRSLSRLLSRGAPEDRVKPSSGCSAPRPSWR
jgi:hypothetical protein